MVDIQQVTETIFHVIDEINQLFPQYQLEKSLGAVLFGSKEKALDSLGLVIFIVAVEQKIAKSFGVSLVLANEKAMSFKDSPFRTVETLIKYVAICLEEGDQ